MLYNIVNQDTHRNVMGFDTFQPIALGAKAFIF